MDAGEWQCGRLGLECAPILAATSFAVTVSLRARDRPLALASLIFAGAHVGLAIADRLGRRCDAGVYLELVGWAALAAVSVARPRGTSAVTALAGAVGCAATALDVLGRYVLAHLIAASGLYS